jgi:hypothetical protein
MTEHVLPPQEFFFYHEKYQPPQDVVLSPRYVIEPIAGVFFFSSSPCCSIIRYHASQMPICYFASAPTLFLTLTTALADPLLLAAKSNPLLIGNH